MVARSSAESELRYLAHDVWEMVWLRNLLWELKQQASEPLKLYYDNKVAINIIHNPVYHGRTTHVGIEDGMGCIIYVPTWSQVADVLTKSLQRLDFERLVDKFELHNIYSQTWGGV